MQGLVVAVADDPLVQVRAFVAQERTLSLATLGPDGGPQAAVLYYAETEDLGLYFISAPNSRHATNIGRDSRVAATIHADSPTWRDIRGLQLEGSCAPVTGARRAPAWARYSVKFPFVLADAALARALARVSLYRITPHWLRWIDNTVRLGHNQEWVLVDGVWQTLDPAER